MDDVFRLDGEIALITGGGTGLGFAIARCMAAAGARVVLVGRRETELREAVAEIGTAASYQVHDVTQLDRAGELVARVTAAVGAPTILVNNAGIHVKKAAVETSEQEFQSVLQTHVMGAYALTRAVVPGMLARGSGSILFTSSMAALIGLPLVVAYSAAKAAYGGMVRSLAAELSPRGIRVNAIVPGWIETPMLRQVMDADPARLERVLSRTPMGRFGKDDDIGWAAVYLSSPAAEFITGVHLPVDGGASIGF
jgi:gluconate 5-dehydrogenase